MEACGSAHHWARELTKLGHDVKLMPPAYVKPYVKRGKTDAGDAEAIAEAVTRPTMRFVAVKTIDQQAVLMLHKVRDLLTRQRTMLINALRGHLGEFGMVAPAGAGGVAAAIRLFREVEAAFPDLAQGAVNALVSQLESVTTEIRKAEVGIIGWHRQNSASRRLAEIPGVGPLTASAIVATVADPSLFRSGRQFAAWLGLTPRSNSSGGKFKLGRISKMGDGYQTASGHWRDVRHQDRSTRTGPCPLDSQAVKSQARQSRFRRAGQQDCPDCLGHVGARCPIRGSRRVAGAGLRGKARIGAQEW
jgi:transposase